MLILMTFKFETIIITEGKRANKNRKRKEKSRKRKKESRKKS